MTSHIALLVNPASGRRRAAVTAVRLKGALREAGARVHVYAGKSAADSRRMARPAASDGPDALVAVGGAGPARQALQGVVDTGVPLGVVPAATAHDIAGGAGHGPPARQGGVPTGVPRGVGRTGPGHGLARAFGSPRGAARAVAEARLAGRPRAADAGRLRLADGTQRYFLSVLACGFDARVNERVNTFRFKLGRAGYLVGLLSELRAFQPIDFGIEVDGRRIDKPGMLVAVGNTCAYGGGIHICPDADPEDGLLDVVFVEQGPLGRF